MRSMTLALFVVSLFAATNASADDAKEDAVKRDRHRIKGTWVAVMMIVDGNKSMPEDARKITVVNGDDGTWSVRANGNEVAAGVSTFDPTKEPKSIDFTPTIGGGKGEQFLGIYELGENKRRLCFAAAGKPRPTEFASPPGSDQLLVEFERVKQE